MSTILLFCIGDVPIEIINDLFRIVGTEMWRIALATDPAQPCDRYGTTPPVTQFTNGFRASSVSQLQRYVENPWAEDTIKRIFRESQLLAVLDERSARDNSVIIQSTFPQSFTTGGPSEGEDEVATDDEPQQWCSWRVKFEDVSELAVNVSETLESVPALCRDEFIDDNGIFDLHRAIQAWIDDDNSIDDDDDTRGKQPYSY